MGKKDEESLCTLILDDWPRELGKESGTATIGPHTICKSFEFIIERSSRKLNEPLLGIPSQGVQETMNMNAIIWQQIWNMPQMVCSDMDYQILPIFTIKFWDICGNLDRNNWPSMVVLNGVISKTW